jgi:hypothetical protein
MRISPLKIQISLFSRSPRFYMVFDGFASMVFFRISVMIFLDWIAIEAVDCVEVSPLQPRKTRGRGGPEFGFASLAGLLGVGG